MKKIRHLFLVLAALAVVGSSVTPVRAADIAITAASVAASNQAQTATVKAGATVTAGQPLYKDTTTNTYKLADANAVTPIFKVAGIALNGASTGQYVTIVKSDPALAIGGTVASGAVVILSATAGAIAPVADAATGMNVTVLGVGTGSNKINFRPLTGGAVP